MNLVDHVEHANVLKLMGTGLLPGLWLFAKRVIIPLGAMLLIVALIRIGSQRGGLR